MKRRGSGETSLINCFVRGLYKVIAIRSSELMARVRDKSNSVVYNGMIREITK